MRVHDGKKSFSLSLELSLCTLRTYGTIKGTTECRTYYTNVQCTTVQYFSISIFVTVILTLQATEAFNCANCTGSQVPWYQVPGTVVFIFRDFAYR